MMDATPAVARRWSGRGRLAFAVLALAALALAECCAAPASGIEAVWDYLPLVGYDSEDLRIAVRLPGGGAGWAMTDEHGAALPVTLDAAAQVLSATIPVSRCARVQLARGDDRLALRLVRPGQAVGLALDAQRRLVQGGELAVLVLPRVEAHADRRWTLLGLVEQPDVAPCTLLLDEPAVPWGEAALTAQACDAQRLQPEGRGVLVRLSGADRLAGWKHREYRQMAAWLVADLLARNAKRVVLVEPLAPAAEAAALAPLRTQIADVGGSYHCRVVATASLSKDSCWEVAPGVLGASLNAHGRAALAELLEPWWRGP
jgi:hypothetical protein